MCVHSPFSCCPLSRFSSQGSHYLPWMAPLTHTRYDIAAVPYLVNEFFILSSHARPSGMYLECKTCMGDAKGDVISGICLWQQATWYVLGFWL